MIENDLKMLEIAFLPHYFLYFEYLYDKMAVI